MRRCLPILLASLASLGVAASAGTGSEVAALHAKVITPSSNALFEAESSPPSTAAEWEKLRASAAELAQAASRLASKELARDQSQWSQFALTLKSQAEHAAAAAQKKDQDALVVANGDIVSVCEDCHAKYRDAGRSMKQ